MLKFTVGVITGIMIANPVKRQINKRFDGPIHEILIEFVVNFADGLKTRAEAKLAEGESK